MKLKTQDNSQQNTRIVFANIAKLLRINVSYETINSIQDNSLESIMNCLNDIQVQNIAVRTNIFDINELPTPLIAHIKSGEEYFVIVTNVDSNNIKYHDPIKGWTNTTLESFSKVFSGVVLLVEKNSNSHDSSYLPFLVKAIQNYTINLATIVTLLFLTLGILLSKLPLSNTLFSIASALGIVASLVLTNIDLGNISIGNICKINKNFDCQSVINSPAGTIFGIYKLSDIGLVWFMSIWITPYINKIFYDKFEIPLVIYVLSIVFCIYTPYSIFYQWRIIKKWCMFCIITQIVIIYLGLNSSFILSKSHSYLFNTSNLTFVFSILLTLLLWFWIKPLLRKNNEFNYINAGFNYFKNNIDTFELMLRQQHAIDFNKVPNDIGKLCLHPDYYITLVTNPTCKYCIATHLNLKKLMLLFENISITIVFKVDANNKNSISYKVAKCILSLPEENRMKALDLWFELLDFSKWHDIFCLYNEANANDVLADHLTWTIMNAVEMTPTIFLNNKQLNHYYSMTDLSKYILTKASANI